MPFLVSRGIGHGAPLAFLESCGRVLVHMASQMNDEQQLAFAKEFRDISHNDQVVAERRGVEIAGEFTRLEIQIAAVLLGLTMLFIPSVPNVFSMKFAVATAFSALIASLGFGLVNLKRKENFWDETLNERITRFRNWDKVVQRELSYEEARGFHNGSSLHKDTIKRHPIWMWIAQSVCLTIAIALIFSLALVFLFSA